MIRREKDDVRRRQRACEPCTKAKARCHFGERNGGFMQECDRCRRLGIDCVEKTGAPGRRPRRIRSEQSIPLHPIQSVPGPSNASHDMNHVNVSGIPQPGTTVPHQQPSASSSISSQEFTPATSSNEHVPPEKPPLTPPPRPPSSLAPRSAPYGLSWSQANDILCIYRDHYARNLLCVIIDKHVTAEQLARDKPFLFRSIMLVAAPVPPARRQKMQRGVLAFLGQQVLVEQRRYGDFLQGLLVCLSWADLQGMCDQQVTTLTYMALGYAHSLGITKIPLSTLKRLGAENAPEDIRHTYRAHLIRESHSIEEQRAFIGLCILLAFNSTQFGRLNPLNNQYVGLCCDSLGWSRERPSDFFLERLGRMTQMGDKIPEVFGLMDDVQKDKLYVFLSEGEGREWRKQLNTVMQTVEEEERSTTQPEDTKASDDPDDGGFSLQDYRKAYFAMYHNYLLVRRYEPATFLTGMDLNDTSASMHRSMCLMYCLTAAKEYFDIFLSLPNSHMLYETISNMQQTNFVLIVATRLLLLEVPGWDATIARTTLELKKVVYAASDAMVEAEKIRVKNVKRFAEKHGEPVTEETLAPGPFADTAKKTSVIGDWLDQRLDGSAMNLGGMSWDLMTEWLEPFEEGMYNRGGNTAMEGDGGQPMWYSGLLTNSAWNFDEI